MMSEQQLALNLPVRTAQGRMDFLVAPCNAQAVALVDCFPDWPKPVQCFYGVSGCGKSHLVAVLSQHYKVVSFVVDDLTDTSQQVTAYLNGTLKADIVVVDALHNLTQINEEILFHMLNHAHHGGAPLLLLAQHAPAYIDIKLPDLASRLRAIEAIAMRAPDDFLVAGLLQKLFIDRQLRVDRRVIDYMVMRVERDFASIGRIVEALDKLALQEKKSITVPFVARVLESY